MYAAGCPYPLSKEQTEITDVGTYIQNLLAVPNEFMKCAAITTAEAMIINFSRDFVRKVQLELDTKSRAVSCGLTLARNVGK